MTKMTARQGFRLALVIALVPLLAGWGNSGGCPPPDDGMSCGGNLIAIGNSMARVYEKCGPPLAGNQRCDAYGQHCCGTWVYRPNDGDFPRYIGFSDDIVRSIRAGSRF